MAEKLSAEAETAALAAVTAAASPSPIPPSPTAAPGLGTLPGSPLANGSKATAAAVAKAKASAAAATAAAAAAAAGARLEPGQYASVADALLAADAGDTIILGPGHHWEVSVNAARKSLLLCHDLLTEILASKLVSDVLVVRR